MPMKIVEQGMLEPMPIGEWKAWEAGVKYGRRLLVEALIAGAAMGLFLGILVGSWLAQRGH